MATTSRTSKPQTEEIKPETAEEITPEAVVNSDPFAELEDASEHSVTFGRKQHNVEEETSDFVKRNLLKSYAAFRPARDKNGDIQPEKAHVVGWLTLNFRNDAQSDLFVKQGRAWLAARGLKLMTGYPEVQSGNRRTGDHKVLKFGVKPKPETLWEMRKEEDKVRTQTGADKQAAQAETTTTANAAE